MKQVRIVILFFFLVTNLFAQSINLVANIENRKVQNLNGQWKIIIDPYETGYYNYRFQSRTDGYFENKKQKDKSELIEYDFEKSEELTVPGDWNTQKEKLFLYEGTIWYEKSFQFKKKNNSRAFLYFGAVNYEAIVYVNGKKVGEHVGGFTPFNFEVTNQLADGENFVVVKVDNKRKLEGVPTQNTDWWNYGGITRDVFLVDVPETFIKDYFIQLKKNSLSEISGWVQLDGKEKRTEVRIEIPELKKSIKVRADENGFAELTFSADLKLWSPENPKTYQVKIISQTDSLEDNIGFRSIETRGNEILLNGKSIFLRGISLHEEAPFGKGRATSETDADTLLNWAKQLGCNFVRLAHYPHNTHTIRKAEKMGILIWAEIPVYWTILWENKDVLANAENQLKEIITRDKNRAPVIIWSVANETPVSDARMNFIRTLIQTAKAMDSTRLVTAATEIHSEKNTISLSDPLCEWLDVIGVNEYIGWYWGNAEDALMMQWKSKYDKPLVISEFGADAKYNLHGDSQTRWTEEYQTNVYVHQIEMLKKIPFLRGMSPWILVDFRSPRRPLPGIQDMYNRKGLISDKGEKKHAFYTLQNFYREKAK